MKATIIVLTIVVASVGCSPENRRSRAPDTSDAVVSQLYHDYAWEVVLRDSPSRRTLFDEPRDVLLNYFDDSLTTLIERDRTCRERTHEACNLDWVPIWDSNDPQAVDLVVASIDSATVAVSFRRPVSSSDSEVVKLSYRMVMTPRGWRVSDIVRHDGGSLVTVLRRR